MARRPGDDGMTLSPRARRVAGWLAAAALVGGIALGVRVVGGSGDGSPTASEPPSSESVTDAAPITFGTALDPATGLVATPARTSRFESGETFAYSVRDLPAPPVVWVDVERVGDGSGELVQRRAEQPLPAGAAVIAFTVPVDALLDAFGPGEYRMRIYTEQAGPATAEGAFTIITPRSSTAP